MVAKGARQVICGEKGWCQTCETCASTLPRPALVLQIPAYANNASSTRLPRRPSSLPADGIPRARCRFFLGQQVVDKLESLADIATDSDLID
jgi:hypothetical protein